MNNNEKTKTFKTILRFAVGGLVGTFVGSMAEGITGHVEAPKIAKLGAKAGAILVGIHLANNVSNYICEGIDTAAEKLDKLKESIETNEEEE